ncbi:MAG: alanine racemase [Candidatus Krumholzibacteriia bacterium]|jgi:alanine racemase
MLVLLARPRRHQAEPVPSPVSDKRPVVFNDDSWLTILIDRSALIHNIGVFRSLVAQPTRVMAVVKANAYGHGLLLAAEAFLAGGADLLGVHGLSEARDLRDGGITADIIVLGPLQGSEAVQANKLCLEITVPSVELLSDLARQPEFPSRIHLKVDTGVNRQGLRPEEWPQARAILAAHSGLQLVGVSSHFADIEDTTHHEFAERQMSLFESFVATLKADGYQDLQVHMTCSAATLVWDRTHADITRVGVSAYGIWPSRETLVSVRQRSRQEVALRPAMTWQVKVSQVRNVPVGETVSYGRRWKAMTDSKIAVLPVGYSDGWPRSLGGRAHVLIGGRRAPLVGRVCMNLCMVDVTQIPGVQAGDAAVLLGSQGEEVITAEMLAEELGTIPYEILTLPGPSWTRRVV